MEAILHIVCVEGGGGGGKAANSLSGQLGFELLSWIPVKTRG